jgi:hypothetical protein
MEKLIEKYKQASKNTLDNYRNTNPDNKTPEVLDAIIKNGEAEIITLSENAMEEYNDNLYDPTYPTAYTDLLESQIDMNIAISKSYPPISKEMGNNFNNLLRDMIKKGPKINKSMIKKTKEELGDELCNYCDAENTRPTQFHSGCEGSWCDRAYENYIDEFEAEFGDK